MINIEKIKLEKIQPPFLRRPAPAPYFHSLFLIFQSLPPSGEEIKIYLTPLEKGRVPNYVYPLHPPTLQFFANFK